MGRAEFRGETPGLPTKQARHVAVIMDGNGRWAQKRGLPRLAGHRKGVEAVRAMVEACPEFGIEVLTLFAFSTENWKRSGEEVDGLMGLFRRYMRNEAADLEKRGAKVIFIGDRDGLAPDIRESMTRLEARTAENDRITLAIALNYGGRAEITAATRRIAAQVAAGEIDPASITEDMISGVLDTRGLPDPDLMIRTSGEQRISNFMLWQCAYTEFMFVDELWPDFNRDVLARVLDAYGVRERRFGAVTV